jgi:hypothetical protein
MERGGGFFVIMVGIMVMRVRVIRVSRGVRKEVPGMTPVLTFLPSPLV